MTLEDIFKLVLKRIGINNEDVYGCVYSIYDTHGDTSRLAFVYCLGHQNGNVRELTKFYYTECQVDATSNISACKTYVSQPSYGANIELRDEIQVIGEDEWKILSGICGKWRINPDTDDYDWKLLYGWYMDRDDDDKTYMVIPPKSFFVDGTHKDFIAPGRYLCSASNEIVVKYDGVDDDDENSANSEGD